MKIPGWAYIGIGVFITGLSGYLYKFVPKPDGSPNNAMALFFFIGIIFILIGLVKTFFKKMDDASNSEYEHAKNELEKAKHVGTKEYKQNRVEAQMNRAYASNENTSKTQSPHTPHHTSQYEKTHPYHGIKQDAQNNQQVQQQHPHASHNQTINIFICKRCGNKNPTSAHYCHSCGNRLT